MMDKTKDSSKRVALFVMSPKLSHLIPSLYLSKHLKESYQIIYTVNAFSHAKIISQNGHRPVILDRFTPFMGMEANYLSYYQKNVSVFTTIKHALTNSVFWHRTRRLEEVVNLLQPDLLFIDTHNWSEYIILEYKFPRIQKIFLNVKSFPVPTLVNSLLYSNGKQPNMASLRSFPGISGISTNIKRVVFRLILSNQRRLLGLKFWHLIAREVFFDRLSTKTARRAELIFAPKSLSWQQATPNRYFLGLCRNSSRNGDAFDFEFDSVQDKFKSFKTKAKVGRFLIYCNFTSSYAADVAAKPTMIGLLHQIVDVGRKLGNVDIIFSLNRPTFREVYSLLENESFVTLCTRAPQPEVLLAADLQICHGGLGSIKESILASVPLLVCPLWFRSDQLKMADIVESLGIGQKCVINPGNIKDLFAQVSGLINDIKYRNNIEMVACDSEYYGNEQRISAILKSLGI